MLIMLNYATQQIMILFDGYELSVFLLIFGQSSFYFS